MSDEFYEEMAVVAAELIEEYGRPASFVVKGAVSGPAWEQTEGGTTLLPVFVVESSWTTKEREAQRIEAKDKRFLVAASEAPPPEARLLDGGVSYEIIETNPLKPGNVGVYLDIQARR